MKNNNLVVKIIIGVLIVITTISVAIIFIGNSIVKSSPAFPYAINYIKNSDNLKKQVGEFKSYGFFLSMKSVSYKKGEKKNQVRYKIPITGAKADCHVSITLMKESGKDWEVTDFTSY